MSSSVASPERPLPGRPASRPAPRNGFLPYSGPWGYEQAAHLLRRTTFGPTYEQIKWSVERGLPSTVEQLFAGLPLPEPPVNASLKGDPDLPFGQTWVESPFNRSRLSRQLEACYKSLRAWTFGLLLNEGISLREKLTLFWHNHFPIEAVFDPRYRYRYITLLRRHAWGDFRQLTKDITIDPAMLFYLNGNQNTKEAPNENYARELLELFTIGKGAPAGPGDYTTFTEQDVKAIARVLTGWKDVGYRDKSTDGKIGVEFRAWEHDPGAKQLSHRFGEANIPDLGDREYAHLIDLIFEQAEVARFICRKLYRWFVYYHIDEEIESSVIEPMAQLLLQHDYQIKPALSALLLSQHFFDSLFSGAMIKNPVDYVMSTVKPTGLPIPGDLEQQYNAWDTLVYLTETMQMKYFDIPQVAGWRAYYLAPVYYRDWITASTLPARIEFVEFLATSGYFPLGGRGPKIRIPALPFLRKIDNPNDPNAVIREFAQLFFPKPLTAEVRANLKEILIPGLPDFEWTVEYGNYRQNPSDVNLANAVETKLRNLLKAMLSMAEFQLS